MTQYNFGTIDPYVVDGVQLAGMLNQWRDAMHTWHRGPSAPSYVVPGMMWIDDSGGATQWIVRVNLSPGTNVAVFAYNTTTGAITMLAGAGGTLSAAALLAQSTAPEIGLFDTNNPVDQKRWSWSLDAAGNLLSRPLSDGGGSTGQQFLFNRNGTLSARGVLNLTSESVLGADASSVAVTFPNIARRIELEYFVQQAASSQQGLWLQLMQGASPLTSGYVWTAVAGSGATVVGSSSLSDTGWTLGSLIFGAGTVHLVGGGVSAGCAIHGTAYIQQAAAARYTTQFSGDHGTWSGVTGARLVFASGNVKAASWMRAHITV